MLSSEMLDSRGWGYYFPNKLLTRKTDEIWQAVEKGLKKEVIARPVCRLVVAIP